MTEEVKTTNEIVQSDKNKLSDTFLNATKKMEEIAERVNEKNMKEVAKRQQELSNLQAKEHEAKGRQKHEHETMEEALLPIQSKINELTNEIQYFHEAIQEIEESNLVGGGETNLVLESFSAAMEKSRRSFASERERIEKLISDETQDQEFAKKQMAHALEKAKTCTSEISNSHDKQIKDLSAKVKERQDILEGNKQLEAQIDIQLKALQELQNHIRETTEDHLSRKEKVAKAHNLRVTELKAEYAAHQCKADLREKIGLMHEIMSDVDETIKDSSVCENADMNMCLVLAGKKKALDAENKKLKSKLKALSTRHTDLMSRMSIGFEIDSQAKSNFGSDKETKTERTATDKASGDDHSEIDRNWGSQSDSSKVGPEERSAEGVKALVKRFQNSY